MKNEELQNIINGLGENLEFTEEGSEYLTLTVSKEQLHAVCSKLKTEPDLKFDYAFVSQEWTGVKN